MYKYRAKLVRIVDADTMVMDVDLGLETTRRLTVRLAEIDAVEKSDPLHPAALVAVTLFLGNNIDAEGFLSITTTKDKREKYGRYLVRIHDLDYRNPDLHHVLVKSGYAEYKKY